MTRRSYNIVVIPVIEYDSLVVQNPAKHGSKNHIKGIRNSLLWSAGYDERYINIINGSGAMPLPRIFSLRVRREWQPTAGATIKLVNPVE